MRSSFLEEKQGNRLRICLGHQKEEVSCTELDCLGGGWEEPGLTSEMSVGWRVRWDLPQEGSGVLSPGSARQEVLHVLGAH